MPTPSGSEQTPLGANTESQSTLSSQNPKPEDTVAEHWSLSSKIEPSKYLTLFARLPNKLTASNFISWMFAVEATLDTIDLLGYINGSITAHLPQHARYENWRAANALVRSILITNMSEEAAVQMSHLWNAGEIWQEAKRLFSGQTMTDYTLTITSLVTTKYVDGEDPAAHTAKMKAFRRDLQLMSRNIDDGLFACLLRISMPPSWNYVFSGLPDNYSSVEVERRIKDEHGIKTNQESVAMMAYRAGDGHKHEHRAGEPFCTNCNKPGHWIAGCWAKGGGAEGKGPRQKKKQRKRDSEKKDKKKGKEKANQAVHDDSDAESQHTHSSYMATNIPSPSHSQFRWILDGGATTHICKDRSAFVNFIPRCDIIGGVNKKATSLEVLGTGDIKVIVTIDGRKDKTITLSNASYCPDAADNLVSESRMDRKGLAILKKKGKVTITKSDGSVVMQGRLLSCNLYELDITLAPYSAAPSHVAFTTQTGQSYDLWHRRLGHIHEGGLRYLAKHDLVTGLNIKIDDTLGPCDGCAKGKHHQAPFPHRVERSPAILDRLHMDLQGPFTASIHGYRFTLAVVDDHSRIGWKRYLKSKDEASEEIQTLITELENNTGQRVKIIRIDGGGEFINGPLKDWLKKKGITLEISAPDTHQQNGVAERFNETTHERALSMLKEAGMSDGFWPEAHQYSNHARNRSPTKAIPLSTPYEVFYNKKPDVSTLRVFGSRCHVRIPKEKRTKLEEHSLDGIFCGFAHRYKAYKVWIPSRHKFITSRDVIVYEKLPESDPLVTPAFDEGVSQDKGISSEGFTKAPAEPTATTPPQTPSKSPNNIEIPFPTPPALEPTIHQPPPAPRIRRTERTTRPTWVKAAADAEKARAATIAASNKVQHELREARRQQKAVAEANTQEPAEASRPLAEQEIVQLAYMAAHGPDTPLSYADAIKSKYADEWREAMIEEINTLIKRGTWVLENLPPGRKPVGCRWTFLIKFGPNGIIIRFKARLVAQGFSQIPGIDFDDTFAPTVRQDVLRILLHLTISFGWYRGQDDVTAAFLNAELVETIYMRQPQGFSDGTDRVCKLVRSLYGLKQAARCWNQHLHAALLKLGYHRTYSDSAVYVRQIQQDVVILAIHVDNFLSFGNTQPGLKSARTQLHETFEMKEEDPNWLMGFLLVENPAARTISIDHSQYINTILKRFNMSDCDPAKIPLDPVRVLSKDDGPSTDSDKAKMANKPYRELIGALTWISVTSHPEIAFAATHLAQFNSNPGEAHWEAGKTVLRYLKGAINCHLTLGLHDGNPTELAAYSDSDWGRDIDSRRSITGYVFLLGLSAISWSSKKQTTVATSSVDGEYQAGSMTVRHGLWLRRLLIELGLDELETSPTTIFIDNRGAIDLTKDNRHHQRTKHIDIVHHFIRERVEDKTFTVIHCPSAEMLADGFTKPLPREPFGRMVDGLGLISG